MHQMSIKLWRIQNTIFSISWQNVAFYMRRKVAPNSLNIPIFDIQYTSKVKEKLKAQDCKAVTNEQI